MANDLEPPDQEPSLEPKASNAEQTKGKYRRKALATAHRELSDEELSSPAVQKLLLDEIDRIESENNDLLEYRSKFHEVDKKVAVLEQQGKQKIVTEIISMTCTTIGAAALGYSRVLWSDQPTAYIAIAFGSILVICGIIAKVIKS